MLLTRNQRGSFLIDNQSPNEVAALSGGGESEVGQGVSPSSSDEEKAASEVQTRRAPHKEIFKKKSLLDQGPFGFVPADHGTENSPGVQERRHSLTPAVSDGNAGFTSPRLAIQSAARSGDHARAKQLLEAKADPNVEDPHGITPMMCAAFGGHASIAKLLVKFKADVDVKSPQGKRALAWAKSDAIPYSYCEKCLASHEGDRAEAVYYRGGIATLIENGGKTPGAAIEATLPPVIAQRPSEPVQLVGGEGGQMVEGPKGPCSGVCSIS